MKLGIFSWATAFFLVGCGGATSAGGGQDATAQGLCPDRDAGTLDGGGAAFDGSDASGGFEPAQCITIHAGQCVEGGNDPAVFYCDMGVVAPDECKAICPSWASRCSVASDGRTLTCSDPNGGTCSGG